MIRMIYSYQRTIKGKFEDIDSVLCKSLMEQGFGIITEIDVKATMQEKLNVEFRNYKILGACNPAIAHEALSMEPEIGLLLPCNVVLWENDDESITMSAIDAVKLLSLTGRDDLNETAEKVNNSLRNAIDAL